MKYDIVKKDLNILTQVSKDWDFSNPPMDATEFATNLIETMYGARGIGLAAIQCGFPYRVFVMIGPQFDYAIFNPKIVSESVDRVDLEESCLSFPGISLNIKRSNEIRVRFADVNGDISTHKFTGLTARTIQHELMHLDGKVFWEGQSRLKVDRSLKQAKKLGFDYSGKGYLKFCKN